nr:ARID DNA-binding domain-containing protein [Tanacetum cinerariifolium]
MRKRLQQDFIQRKMKREKEARLGSCIKQITNDCKDMLRKKLDEIELYNLTIPQNKYRRHKCFKCKQRDKLDDQRKFLFIYGMGEVVIKNDDQGYLIPGVHYAPEVTLNILSIDLLEKQGFEILYEDDRYKLEYMFRNQKGQNLDEDNLRQMQNNFLEKYFKLLDNKDTSIEEDLIRSREEHTQQREKEARLGSCIKQITNDCKDMLRKKLNEIELYNSTIPQNKYRRHKCFKCKQRGHILKFCPIKPKINDKSAEILTSESEKETKEVLKPTKPSVNLKYPECIHFQTKGILKGTDQGNWDDFWYLSNNIDKHLCYKLNSFCNIKEIVLIDKLDDQRKFLFTYGMGEVVIKNDDQGYLIPGVNYAPEVTLNILSIDLLEKQGFEILYEDDRYKLEYMFRNQKGQNLDEDNLRQMQNNFLEKYFKLLDNKDTSIEEDLIRSREEHTQQRFRKKSDKVVKRFYNYYLDRSLPGSIPPTINGVQIHLFDLYKLIEGLGGYLSVYFGQEFGIIGEILGLSKQDGEELRTSKFTLSLGMGKQMSHNQMTRINHGGIRNGGGRGMPNMRGNVRRGRKFGFDKSADELDKELEDYPMAGDWELCTYKIRYYHDVGSMITYHKNLTARGCHALIFRFVDKRPREVEDNLIQKKLQISLNQNYYNEESDRRSSMPNPQAVSAGLKLSYDDEERNSSITSKEMNRLYEDSDDESDEQDYNGKLNDLKKSQSQQRFAKFIQECRSVVELMLAGPKDELSNRCNRDAKETSWKQKSKHTATFAF